jgi:hypothetical protein
MAQANLYSVGVVDFILAAACIAPPWLAFMTKFAHATTEHTKMGRRSTATTTLRELVKEHHIGNDKHFDEDIVVSRTVHYNVFLLFDFNKQFYKLFKQWHQFGFRGITSYSGYVQGARLIHVIFMSSYALLL